MSKITLKSSFEIILGKDANEYPEEVRMQRWEEWKEAARKAKKLWVIEHWSNASACAGCVHMNKEKPGVNSMGFHAQSILFCRFGWE